MYKKFTDTSEPMPEEIIYGDYVQGDCLGDVDDLIFSSVQGGKTHSEK